MRNWMMMLTAASALFVSACQPVMSPAIGLFYADVKGPIAATSTAGTKQGQSCARSILGIVATGDASIEAAKRAGGIREVSSVDHHTTNMLGIVGDFCTVVTGN
ncbi:TRL-like family protein [bacterium]|nr:TRL-like family protein [bacterium]